MHTSSWDFCYTVYMQTQQLIANAKV